MLKALQKIASQRDLDGAHPIERQRLGRGRAGQEVQRRREQLVVGNGRRVRRHQRPIDVRLHAAGHPVELKLHVSVRCKRREIVCLRLAAVLLGREGDARAAVQLLEVDAVTHAAEQRGVGDAQPDQKVGLRRLAGLEPRAEVDGALVAGQLERLAVKLHVDAVVLVGIGGQQQRPANLIRAGDGALTSTSLNERDGPPERRIR